MVYSTRRFVVNLALCYFVLVSSVLWALRLPRLGKIELILVLFVRLFDLRLFGFVCFLFLLVSACDCGTLRNFLLPFFFLLSSRAPFLERKIEKMYMGNAIIFISVRKVQCLTGADPEGDSRDSDEPTFGSKFHFHGKFI